MNLNPFRRRGGDESRSLSEAQILDIAFGYSALSNLSSVTQETAAKSTAVLACLIVRAETFASLPVHIYRSRGDMREKLPQHSLALPLTREWNPMMTAVEGWRWKQLTEDVRGNALVRVERRPGNTYYFWPLTSKSFTQRWDGSQLVYDYEGDAVTPKGTYGASEILHFKGPLVKDAWKGTSLVDQASTAIGLTISAEKFYERLISNGNHFPGWLESDTALKPADMEAIANNMAALSGLDHAGETRIFDRGLKYKQNGMSVVDSDLTNQMLWYLQEVCRIFRVPPSLVQDWSKATYTNSEQADLWFAKHTIAPIAINTEAVIGRMFTNRNELDTYVKFELDGLLRGDFKTRMEGYRAAVEGGFKTRQEVRRLEDDNPITGLEKPLIPLNFAQIDENGNVESNDQSSDVSNDTHDEPDNDDMPDALEPIRSEKVELIRARKAQDAERGRDEAATRAFAEKVLTPLAEAYALAGREFDTEALIHEAIDREDD